MALGIDSIGLNAKRLDDFENARMYCEQALIVYRETSSQRASCF